MVLDQQNEQLRRGKKFRLQIHQGNAYQATPESVRFNRRLLGEKHALSWQIKVRMYTINIDTDGQRKRCEQVAPNFCWLKSHP